MTSIRGWRERTKVSLRYRDVKTLDSRLDNISYS